MSEPAAIDWWLAERVGSAVAGSDPPARIRHGDVARWSEEGWRRVIDYTGMDPGHPPPPPELVGRRGWLRANLETLHGAAEVLERRLGARRGLPGPLAPAWRVTAGAALGAQLGAASGYVSRLVLGQYEVALVGPERPARLLFVVPNLADAQRRLGVARGPFLRWIALHEATHAVQFASVPWLREHLGTLLGELLSSSEPAIDPGALTRHLMPPDPRRIARYLREADPVSLVVSRSQREAAERIQVTMALVEGYAEHVMDAAARPADDLAALRARLERARRRRGAVGAVLMRLLGLDHKLRQYRLGKAFSDAVARHGGVGVLNRVWEGPEALPTGAELERPASWVRRVAG